ncbi:MAG: multiheme c-type cytochrome [Pseudomonadota bacterium]
MGGLSKRSYQINTLTDKNSPAPILLDAGNLLFKQPTVTRSQELLTAAGLMEIYQQMVYDAVAVGPYDLAAGVEFLKNGLAKGFPWLSANLMDKHHKPIFPAVRIITRDNIKIGIIGLTGQITAASQEIVVTDWREVLPEQLKQLAEDCQLVIALSNLSGEDNAELTRNFPQVHVLFTAEKHQGNVVPKVANNTLVTQTINQGKYLGILDLDWIPGISWGKNQELEGPTASEQDSSQPPSRFSGNFIALTKNLPEDQQIAAHLEEIKQQINLYNQKLAASANNPQSPANNHFSLGLAGSARCRECHPLQTAFWNSTKHAQAYATLQRQRQNINLDCLPCHITKNSFPATADSAPVESLLTLPATLLSVGCETCHGARLAHAESPDQVQLTGKVDEKVCIGCHTMERDPAFDYRQKSPLVSCPTK